MKRPEVTNADLFLWALHDLGGAAKYIDVEDVYVKCFELAPRRFAWRTKDLPDYKKCAKALRDAEARSPILLVKTGDGLCRQLSAEGQRWVTANAGWIAEAVGGAPVPAPKRRPESKALREVERSDVFQHWRETGELEPEKWEIADVLRCSTDSSLRVWKERVQVLRSLAFAASHDEMLRFLDSLVKSNASWFGEGEGS